MSPAVAYGALAAAIVFEVVGTSMLPFTRGFTRLWPTLAALACYGVAFFFLAQVVRSIPVGIVYAIWSGLGVALIVTLNAVAFGQRLDFWAMAGVGLIVAGVVVINLLSSAAPH
ncbi:SMR family transporter [Amaricoccus sp.]|uniref:SMR family transporter n=1 Tax=Amaricoccus sp. TaxID=1872485 RepID=UPI001B7BEFA5|nr:SMR family transporter [Amaricoccus sp.]MBP7001375.1 QacE family quaternary ammonium compound efflux SMR transporter [Amaricoccus sp.]